MQEPPSASLPPACTCPLCGTELECMVVTVEGALIGCEACAGARGIAGPVVSREAWEAQDAVHTAAAAFGLVGAVAFKPQQGSGVPQWAHVWGVRADGRTYVLKRYPAWLADPGIRYEHSVLACLATHHLPVAAPLAIGGGTVWTDPTGDRWALFPTLPGATLPEQNWMWHMPRAAGTLAALHLALADSSAEGEPHPPWTRWSLEKLDATLMHWPALADLTPALVANARQRLADRYFTEALLTLPQTIVHGDYGTANLLWQGDAVSGVLNFERAHRDAAIGDFGGGLGSQHPPLLRAALATYSRVRPLTAGEREMLPEALLLGALIGIDAQLTVYHNVVEADRRARTVSLLLHDAETLRRAAALK